MSSEYDSELRGNIEDYLAIVDNLLCLEEVVEGLDADQYNCAVQSEYRAKWADLLEDASERFKKLNVELADLGAEIDQAAADLDEVHAKALANCSLNCPLAKQARKIVERIESGKEDAETYTANPFQDFLQ